jgi:TetR/AcrR family transcriptional repressor of nem operon
MEHLLMRYEKGHKETTRRRILETASVRFRRDGIDGVGVADLMSEAGLTHGGFYSHFSSKEDLVRQAVEEASLRSQERFNRRIEEGGLEAWIRNYMRSGHRDHPELGCVVAPLVSEIARHPKATRAAFTGILSEVLASIETHLSAVKSPARRRTAIAIFATVMGSIQLARAVSDSGLSEEILEAGLASALALARIKTPAA